MDVDIKIILSECKNEILYKYSGSKNFRLKHTDYLLLSEEIFDISKISLSLTTLRRIFQEDYDGNPKISTLNAFALYLGFTNWKEYCKRFKDEKSIIYSPRIKKSAIIIITVSIILIIAIISILILYLNTKKTYPNIKFSHSDYNKTEIPSTILFKYDIRNIKNDSVILHPLGYMEKGKDDLILLNPDDSVLTYTYFWPQIFYPKLTVNGEIISQLKIEYVTNKWLASITQRTPFYIKYFDDKEIFSNGKLAFSEDILKRADFPVGDVEQTGFTLFKDFGDINSDSLYFSTRIKNNLLERSPESGKIMLALFFEDGEIYLNFHSEKSSFGKLELDVFDSYHSTKRENLSFLYHNFENWTSITSITLGKNFELYKNDSLVFQTNFATSPGEIKGLRFLFNGLGEVDFIRFGDQDNKIIYSDEFN